MVRAMNPIRSLLLMVFFLSIGMLIDPAFVLRNLGAVLTLVGIVFLLNSVINVLALRAVGESWRTAFIAGLRARPDRRVRLHSRGGRVVERPDHRAGQRVVVAVIALSLVISPFWLELARRLHTRQRRAVRASRLAADPALARARPAVLRQRSRRIVQRSNELAASLAARPRSGAGPRRRDAAARCRAGGAKRRRSSPPGRRRRRHEPGLGHPPDRRGRRGRPRPARRAGGRGRGDPARPLDGLADSKLLDAPVRERLARSLREVALIGVAAASVDEIDRINILHASMLAMRRARAPPRLPARSRADRRQSRAGPALPADTVVAGDRDVPAISAASIVAKVMRDRLMRRLAARYPGYGWESNVGYATALHRDAVRRLGATCHHRRSFATVQGELF